MTHAKLKVILQNNVVKKYKLGSNDRYFLMMGGCAGSTGLFHRKREFNSLVKLLNLGLLKKETTRFGTYDFLLTDLGQQAAAHISSVR